MSSQVGARLPRLNAAALGPSLAALRLNLREVVAAVAALAALLYVGLYYFTSVSPVRERLEAVQRQYQEQLKTISGAVSGQGQAGPSRAELVNQARESIEAFRANRLKPLDPGRKAIFDEINALVRKHNLQLSSGVEMRKVGDASAPSEGGSKGREKTVEDLLNVFPRRLISFTAVGPYPSIRKLTAELEQSKQFFVIESLTITNADEAEGPRGGRRGAPSGALAVSVEMAAYFRP